MTGGRRRTGSAARRRRPVAPAAVALAAGAALLVAPARARAETPVRAVEMRFAEKGGNLVVSAAFTELFDRRAFAHLSSGFPTTVAVQMYAFREGGELPVAAAAVRFRVLYDLWDEDYLIRIDTAGGHRTIKARTRAQALRRVTELHAFPIGPLTRFAIGPDYVLAMSVELNPISDELLAEMRRWLTRPVGGAQFESDTSFFGSYVSVFVNPNLRRAERTLRLRSQPFYRVKR